VAAAVTFRIDAHPSVVSSAAGRDNGVTGGIPSDTLDSDGKGGGFRGLASVEPAGATTNLDSAARIVP
jgi:hypothetical protein